MKRTAICLSAVLACMAVLILALPVAAQTGDAVFPGVQKRTYAHDIDKVVLPPAGFPFADVIPWHWHAGQDYVNVAGVQFVLKYDPYEVNILGVTPAPVGPFSGHVNFPLQGFVPPSTGTPVPNNVLPAALTGTIWISHDQANQSGITIPSSAGVPLFDLRFQPRHTSQVALNSDIDILVSTLRPIYHVTGLTHLNSFWTQAAANTWTHLTSISVPGKLIPHSSTYFQGPLDSLSAPIPLHASGTIPAGAVVIPLESSVALTTTGGAVLHWGSGPGDIPPGSGAPLPGPVTSLSILIQPSSFYVASAVEGVHSGFGVDHIPEPATLVLLAMGGLAAAMQRWTRRRRRRTT